MDFSFLIEDIPFQVACSYIQSYWQAGWMQAIKETVYLIAAYYDSNIPESLQTMTMGYCFSSTWQTTGTRWLWLGTRDDLFYARKEAEQTGNKFFLSLVTQKVETQSWKVGNCHGSKQDVAIMGIVNMTPDSFYDGGKYNHHAIEHIEKLVQEGVDIIDIGGASSRPFAKEVSKEEELSRILPIVIWCKKNLSVPVSVDTYHSDVAEVVLNEGVDMINDISLLHNAAMAKLVASFKAAYCLMHTQGTPQTMQENPKYSDVLGEVFLDLQKKITVCEQAGIESDKIFIDPGVGFGKTVEHNVTLLQFLSVFTFLNKPILIGTSQKSMFSHLLGREGQARKASSLASQVLAYKQKAQVFRVHQVAVVKDAIMLAQIYDR